MFFQCVSLSVTWTVFLLFFAIVSCLFIVLIIIILLLSIFFSYVFLLLWCIIYASMCMCVNICLLKTPLAEHTAHVYTLSSCFFLFFSSFFFFRMCVAETEGIDVKSHSIDHTHWYTYVIKTFFSVSSIRVGSLWLCFRYKQ